MEPKIPENWETACVVCNEVITHPICIDCLEKGVLEWLMLNNPDFIPLVKSVGEFFKNGEEEKRIACILCGNRINVCSYCYKNEIYDFLMESNFNLAEKFREIFFDYGGFKKKAS